MPRFTLADPCDWDTWRRAARAFVLAGVAPEDLTWTVGEEAGAVPDASGGFTLPRALVALLASAFQAREPERLPLLYTVLWRAHHEGLTLADAEDPDLRLARRWALAVRADAHRMRAHLRFLSVQSAKTPCFLGWYRPDHFVLEANTRLLARWTPETCFAIVTPDGTGHHDPHGIRFGAGLGDPGDDATLRAWWDDHHAAILEAAHPGHGMPEAESLDESPRPFDRPPLAPVVLPPRGHATAHLNREARTCTRCDLAGPATQTVFGEGPEGAAVMFIGEQPGDQEDTIGRPFVGPAGQLLDEALEEAGIDRRLIYITNAVKHFKFVRRGGRRIHEAPNVEEIGICRTWLDSERQTVKPRLLVLLGGSAGRAVLGRAVAVTRERGRPFRLANGTTVFLTVHPSYLLRQPNPETRRREHENFLKDLRAIKVLMEEDANASGA